MVTPQAGASYSCRTYANVTLNGWHWIKAVEWLDEDLLEIDSSDVGTLVMRLEPDRCGLVEPWCSFSPQEHFEVCMGVYGHWQAFMGPGALVGEPPEVVERLRGVGFGTGYVGARPVMEPVRWTSEVSFAVELLDGGTLYVWPEQLPEMERVIVEKLQEQ